MDYSVLSIYILCIVTVVLYVEELKSMCFRFQHPSCLVQYVVECTTVGPRTETGNSVCFSLYITVRSWVVTMSKPFEVVE